ncbi:MAG: hypothetical protein ACNJA3_27870 (plasmid) [Pseudomonas rhizophila]|uniref:hypothetical protein n=1 Tax=Pseudomonas rhizophila TaxID=2045200 RepID=UPI003F6BCB1A
MTKPASESTRKVYFLDEFVEVDTYQPVHWPENQKLVAGRFPLNPTLRRCFDQTPNEDRESLETEHWWDLPFIISHDWESCVENIKSNQAHHRGQANDYVISDVELEAKIQEEKHRWFAEFPDGVRYDVRCLDGGAWDRSTWWGSSGSLDEAVKLAEAGPAWRSKLG